MNVIVDEEVSFVENLPSCDCANSEFCNPDHKHIVTSDLRLITNSKLRKLLSIGPNYKEPKMLNYRKCKQSIESSLTAAIDTLSEKYNVPVNSLLPWKNKIIELVENRIRSLTCKKVPSVVKPLLRDDAVKNALADLHNKFVVVPIDKASNNVAIICKRFYIQTLLDEVGVPGDASSTYKLSGKDPNEIVQNNAEYCEKLGMNLEED